MAGFSAPAIANELLLLRAKKTYPVQMQIQKLVFNANGWNLAISHSPLVSERAQAWDNGPVYRSIWNHVRDYGYGDPFCQLVNPQTGRPYKAALSDEQLRIIKATWEKYGSMSGEELSEMSHQPGTPWTSAYFGKGRNAGISNSETEAYYKKLAMAGRGQRV